MLGWTMLENFGPCLILEFCANGNLLNFLQKLRPLIKDGGGGLPTGSYKNCLSLKDLIVRAWQVGNAMVKKQI